MPQNILKKTVLIMLLVLVLTACGNPVALLKAWLNEDKEEAVIDVIDTSGQQVNASGLRDTILYYKDNNGLLIPVMRKIQWPEGRGIAKEALSYMIDNQQNREDMAEIGLYPVIPNGTRILGMTIRDGLCKVDFSSEFLNAGSKEAEENLIKSVVYTLTEFPAVSEVEFQIEGKNIENLRHGTYIGSILKRENINYLGKKPAADTVLVYYENIDSNNPMFVPVTKPIEVIDDKSDANILDVLDSLMVEPPSESGLQSRIPVNTKVIGVEINDSIAEVYLSEEILEIKKDENVFERAVQSIALTLKEHYKNLTGVKIYVHGKIIASKNGEEIYSISYVNPY